MTGCDAVERRLAALLSADTVGYSRWMAEHEAGTIRTLTSDRHEISGWRGAQAMLMIAPRYPSGIPMMEPSSYIVLQGVVPATLSRRSD